jgi:hypothetical protein
MTEFALPQDLAEGPERAEESLAVINELRRIGVDNAVVLMRHSAREFKPEVHDLENPLTERGRELAIKLGEGLDPDLMIRSYASPPARCIETASLISQQHIARGGKGQATRVVEGLGVFYILDQIRMWKGMSIGDGGMTSYLQRWFDDELGGDEMIPADQAANIIFNVMVGKLLQQKDKPALDICVSHDTSLIVVREKLLQFPLADFGAIEFLDCIVLYRESQKYWLRSRWGDPVQVTAGFGL